MLQAITESARISLRISMHTNTHPPLAGCIRELLLKNASCCSRAHRRPLRAYAFPCTRLHKSRPVRLLERKQPAKRRTRTHALLPVFCARALDNAHSTAALCHALVLVHARMHPNCGATLLPARTHCCDQSQCIFSCLPLALTVQRALVLSRIMAGTPHVTHCCKCTPPIISLRLVGTCVRDRHPAGLGMHFLCLLFNEKGSLQYAHLSDIIIHCNFWKVV